MNMNSRDKLILVAVLVIVIWVAGILVFIKPAIDDVRTASQNLDAKEIELADLQKQIKEDEDLPQQCEEAYNNLVDTAKIFYPVQRQHEAMMEVQGLLDVKEGGEQEIQNLDMSINVQSAVSLARYVFNPDVVETTFDDIIPSTAAETDVAIEALQLSAYNMSFNFTATKADLMTFLDSLQNKTPRSLVIDSIEVGTVSENEDDTEWTGEITMEFIMVPSFPSPDDVDTMFPAGGLAAEGETVDAVPAE